MKPVTLLTLAAFLLPTLCFAQKADRVATAAEKSLSAAPYKNVQVSVRKSVAGSVVTLTGTVDLYAAREAAEDEIGRIRGISAIQNEIRIVTPAIPDDKLRANVEESMAGIFYRRLGYLPNISRFLSIDARNGVVSLSGYVPSLQMAHDLFEATAHTRGVREIVNQMQLHSNPVVDSSWASAPLWLNTGVTSQ
jgi:hyperosmotically inducible periplasmic protein